MTERQTFEAIRSELCASRAGVHEGKMMSSDAIKFNGKVFAFFSTKNCMVFKLGKAANLAEFTAKLDVFNPFKNKGPLAGWYQASFSDKAHWKSLAHTALNLMENGK
jgi:hypothetical protein